MSGACSGSCGKEWRDVWSDLSSKKATRWLRTGLKPVTTALERTDEFCRACPVLIADATTSLWKNAL